MKQRLLPLLVILVLLATNSLAQQKSVLFDAAHAQTAGNADWTLDEDSCGTAQRYPTPDDIIATAESFIGVPYLWGGTSAHGIDCSGLTQRVYFLNGVGLDRDADQQALGGRPVDVARPGDLFFFGAEISADDSNHPSFGSLPRFTFHARLNKGG